MKYLIILGFLIACGTKSKQYVPSKEKLLAKANFFYEKEDYFKAKLYFDTLININPFDGEFYFKRGYSESLLLESESAIKDYKMAIAYNYRPKSANLNIGVIYFNDSLFSKAVPFFEKCLELEPNNKVALELKAASVNKTNN